MTEAKEDGWAVVSMKNDWNQDLPVIGMVGANTATRKKGGSIPISPTAGH